MVQTHTKTLARTKRALALALVVSLCMNDIGQVSAITYDSSTSTYFDTIDDFGLATGSDSVALQFGGALGEFLRWNRSLDKFVFTDDLDVQGTASGAALTIMGGNSYFLGKLGVGTSVTPDTQFEVVGTISGSVIRAGALSVSGSFTLEQSTTLSGSTIRGFGLNVDCDTAGTSKLLWDTTTGRFSCGTDSDTTYTAGQGLNLSTTSFRLNTTVTGAVIQAANSLASSGSLSWKGSGSGQALVLGGGAIIASTTGSVVFNENSKPLDYRFEGDNDASLFMLDASTDKVGIGNFAPESKLEVSGTVSGLTLYATKSFSGAGLTDCDTAGTSKLLWDTTTGRFSCGTDTDTNTTYTAGQGLNLSTTSFRLNTTVTGAVIQAANSLASSGSLSWKGSGSGQALVLGGGAIIASTTGSVVFNENSKPLDYRFEGDNDASLFMLDASTDKVGIGNFAPESKLEVSGTVSGLTLYATQSFSGAGLTTCSNATTSKLLWNSTTGRFSCGTDQGSTYTAGQGLNLSTASFRLNTTVTGAVIQAANSLASSGSLSWKGSGSGQALAAGGGAMSISASGASFFNIGTKSIDFGVFGRTNNSLFYVDASGSGTSATASGGIGIGTRTPVTQLHVAGRVPTKQQSLWSLGTGPLDIEIQGKILYAIDSSGNLKIADVSNASSPVTLATLSGFGSPTDIVVQGSYAYVSTSLSVKIVDVSNPKSPTIVSTTPSVPGAAGYMAISGPYLYLNDATNQLTTFDISNPTAATITATATTGGRMVADGNYLYAIDAGTFKIFSLRNAAAPQQVSSTSITNGANIAVQGRYAYITRYSSSAMNIVDISDPSTPVTVGTVTLGTSPQSVAVQGRYAYVTDFLDGTLKVVDVSSPVAPVVLGTVATGGATILNVVVSGRYGYVANRDSSNVSIFDLGGAYVQQLEAGGAEVGSLAVRNNVIASDGTFRGAVSAMRMFIAGNGAFSGSLKLGQGLTTSSGNILFSRTGAVVFNEQSRDVDLRIEGDTDANLFMIDASTDRVGVGIAAPKAKFSVAGTMSGFAIIAQQSFSGAGLTDCDTGATSKLLWDATTGRFSCGTDQTGGGSMTAGQGLSLNGTVLSLSSSISGTLLEFRTVSGALVYAERQLSTSGSTTLGEDSADSLMVWSTATFDADTTFNKNVSFGDSDTRSFNVSSNVTFNPAGGANAFFNVRGDTNTNLIYANASTDKVGIGTNTPDTILDIIGTVSGVTLYATKSFSGAGLTDCDTGATSKLLWDATTGRFSCGTDQTGGGSMTAGQGLSLNGTTLSLTPFHSGTTIWALSSLRSSGTLVWEGAGSGSRLNVGAISTSGSLSVEGFGFFGSTAFDGNHGISITASTSNVSYIDFYEDTTKKGNIYLQGASDTLVINDTNVGPTLINPAGGNVGVGMSDVTPKSRFAVNGIMSGVTLYATTSFSGAGLTSCSNGTTDKLLWNSTTGRFSCGSDQTGGSSGGGMAYATASGIFLKRSGGTMTGTLNIQSGNAAAYTKVPLLNVRGTMSGRGLQIFGSGVSLSMSGGTFLQVPGSDPRTMSGIDLNANVNNVFVAGNYVYTVSDAVTGNEFRSIDVANPNAPVIVGGFDTGQNTKALFVSTRHAFIGMNGTGAGSGMYIIDNANPGAPRAVSRLNFQSAVNSIYVSGKYVFVGLDAMTRGVCSAKYQTFTGCDFAIVDFTDVNRPRVIGGLQLQANVNQVYIQNRYAYLALDSVSGNDFRIIDLVNPLDPVAVGGLDVSNNVKSVFASGKYAFIGLSTDASTEFRVIDVSNKASPASLGGLELGSTVESVTVAGDWARLGLTSVSGDDYVTVDLRSPTSPTAIGGVNYGADVNTLAVSGKYAYAGLSSVTGNDLVIVDLSGIETPAASIGSLFAANLTVGDNVRFDNNAYIRNALNVGRGGIISKGALSVQATGTGSAKSGTGGWLTNAIDVRNGTGQHLFSVTENGFAQAGIPYFSTGTVQIATSFMSRRAGYCQPTSTALTTLWSVGLSTAAICAVNGTAVAWSGGSRLRLRFQGANTASAMAGITTTFTETRSTYRPKVGFDIQTGTGTTGLRFYSGVVEASTAAQALSVAAAASTIDYAALAWEDGISGTQWMCCSGDGTNHSCQSMGVAVQTSTEYTGFVDWSAQGKVTCTLQVGNKTYTSTKTSNVSTANVALGINAVLVNKAIASATARVVNIGKLYLEQN